MTIPSIINFIFNPRIIEEYLELINDPEFPSLEVPFPFLPSEFPVIRWYLLFATTACAYRLLNDEKESLLDQIVSLLNEQEFEVRVGDYVNAKGLLSKVRVPLGPRGWLLPITGRKIPIRIISITLVGIYLDIILELFSIAERNSLYLDCYAYKQIADECAFHSLGSYWGREPDEQHDSVHLEGLSELIYEHIIRLSNLIKGSSTEMQ